MKNILTTKDIITRESKYIASFAKMPYSPVVIHSGKGSFIEDYEGKVYIDFLSSASSASVGHGNRRIADAVANQMKQIANYTSAYFYTEPMGRLAKALSAIAPGGSPKKVAFGMSGSDSIDGMMKLVRGYTGRSKIISYIGAYHGSTLGAISLSAISTDMKRKIGPLIPEVHHFHYPDCFRCVYGKCQEDCRIECLREIERAFETYLPPDEVAAIVIEPIAGDMGLIVPPKAYMRNLYQLCKKHKILFVVDEIQQALGRTGKWFSIEHFKVEPDVIVMGKALGAGLPISAIIAKAEIMNSLSSPAHLFTMSGNITASVAALENLAIIQEEKLLEHSTIMGKYIKSRLMDMQKRYLIIGDIRGEGLSIGIDLVKPLGNREPNTDAAIRICFKCIELGLLQIYVGKSTLRIQPPINIDKETLDKGLDILEKAFDSYAKGEIDESCYKNISGW